MDPTQVKNSIDVLLTNITKLTAKCELMVILVMPFKVRQYLCISSTQTMTKKYTGSCAAQEIPTFEMP